MSKIIITDLTRFSNKDIVCTAGTDLKTGKCIRPMPYISMRECERLNILPGSILKGKFETPKKLEGPHQEDMSYTNLAYEGPSSSEDFKLALKAGLYKNIEDGFNISLAEKQKHIPLEHKLKRSIITIKVNPKTIKVVEDSFKDGNLKIHFMDSANKQFSFMTITDLGFHGYAARTLKTKKLNDLNDFINNQPEAYLRVGLSRAWNNGTIHAYWMQVNGIYTFPEFLKELRSYK